MYQLLCEAQKLLGAILIGSFILLGFTIITGLLVGTWRHLFDPETRRIDAASREHDKWWG